MVTVDESINRKIEKVKKWEATNPEQLWVNGTHTPDEGKIYITKELLSSEAYTYATLRIQAGHNIADVPNQLGHHSIKFTMDVYYHWIPGKQKSEVDSLDNLHLPAPYTHPEAVSNKKADPEVR